MNNKQEQWDFLDALTLIGFIAQIQNMEKDEQETDYIHKVIQAIANEIQKLHNENNLIMMKLNGLEELIKNDFN